MAPEGMVEGVEMTEETADGEMEGVDDTTVDEERMGGDDGVGMARADEDESATVV